MKAPAVKPTHNTSSLTGSGQLASNPTPVFDNHREDATQLKKISEMTYNSSRTVAQRQAFAEAIGDSDHNPKHNNTGMPDTLKTGLESYSGMDLSDVKVHYNSSRPAQLQALAYAQGSEIHLGPGQEKHLPHEGWHLVQQRQGRVKPTLQMKGGVYINDNEGLEHEADVMGKRSMEIQAGEEFNHTLEQNRLALAPVQGYDIVQRAIKGMKKEEVLKKDWYSRLKDKKIADGYINAEREYPEVTVQLGAMFNKPVSQYDKENPLSETASASTPLPATASAALSSASASGSGGLKDNKEKDSEDKKNREQVIYGFNALQGVKPVSVHETNLNNLGVVFEEINRRLLDKIKGLNRADKDQTASDITVADDKTPMGQLKGSGYGELNEMLRGKDIVRQALAKLNALMVLEQFVKKKPDNTIRIKQKARRFSDTFFDGTTKVPSPGDIQTDNGWAFFTDHRNFYKDKGSMILIVDLVKGIKINKSKVIAQEPVEWWTLPGSSFKYIKQGDDELGKKTYIFEQVENGDAKQADALARCLAEKIAEEEEWSGKEKRKNINELKEALKNKLTIPQILEALNLP